MNKMKIDELLPDAYKILKDLEIAKDGNILRTYRGQIVTFGASIISGSLLSAIAFFSAKGSSKSDRHLLMEAIHRLLVSDGGKDGKKLFDYALSHDDDPNLEEDIFNAAIALKLAMNLFTPIDTINQPEVKPDE